MELLGRLELPALPLLRACTIADLQQDAESSTSFQPVVFTCRPHYYNKGQKITITSHSSQKSARDHAHLQHADPQAVAVIE
jgi:hypothetical protein